MKMYNKSHTILLSTIIIKFIVVLNSCSTIVAGRSQEVTFSSEPKGVEVLVAGKSYGTTPITVNLERKKGQVITFQKDGYNSQTRSLETTINTYFWGNIILGGFIGSTTDAITGSMHEYKPNSYYITLTQDSSTSSNSISNSEISAIKEFIVINYNVLIEDISKGKGNNLEALILRMKLRNTTRDTFILKLKELSAEYKDSPEFADKVLESYNQ